MKSIQIEIIDAFIIFLLINSNFILNIDKILPIELIDFLKATRALNKIDNFL